MASARETEVVVVGGGLAGMTLACALAGAGVDTVVVDRLRIDSMLDPGFDGRTTSLALGSVRILEAIGVWAGMAEEAQPILDIRVADGRPGEAASPFFLHYDHREVGEAPFGYIVENRIMRRALLDRAAELEHLRLHVPEDVARIDRDFAGATVELAGGKCIAASLVVAADGRESTVRRTAGIEVARIAYPQTAIVCTVRHARPHCGVAVELFLPSGPFAMLPLTGRRTNVVWTERTPSAETILDLDEPAFLELLRQRFGDWLGEIELVGPRFSYPLVLMHAARYVDVRLALVGDAAHVIHPIAGQGLNLGLRDVAALAESVVDARRLGLEAGDGSALARYERWRRVDNLVLAAVTDGLNRLFSNDFGPLRIVRDLGLAAVGRMPPLKRFFMRHAMGVVGELPRLVRGRPL